MSGGRSRKAVLIRKVLAADFPLARRRLLKLKVGRISIHFPEVIMQGWMKDYIIYFADLTMDCLTDFAKKI